MLLAKQAFQRGLGGSVEDAGPPPQAPNPTPPYANSLDLIARSAHSTHSAVAVSRGRSGFKSTCGSISGASAPPQIWPKSSRLFLLATDCFRR